jgi:hypothetical protein
MFVYWPLFKPFELEVSVEINCLEEFFEWGGSKKGSCLLVGLGKDIT